MSSVISALILSLLIALIILLSVGFVVAKEKADKVASVLNRVDLETLANKVNAIMTKIDLSHVDVDAVADKVSSIYSKVDSLSNICGRELPLIGKLC
jgi:predicted PurR-regulated permease PerM